MQLHCPDCGTTTDIEEDRIEDVIESHNNSRHDGEQIAGVGPDAVPVNEYTDGDVDPLYAHDMGDDAGPMGEHPDGVRAICKECELVALFDGEFTADDAVDDHNEMCHDGDDVAGLCKWDLQPLPSASDIIDAGGLDALLALGETDP
jgi:hypothetical protein